MARYTPEFLTSVRQRYEKTNDTLGAIAADYKISVRTLHRMREREGWTKRADGAPRGLPAAMRLLDAATTLLAAKPVEGAANCHSRERGNPVIADLAPSAPPGVLGPRLRGDDTPENLFAPSAIERIERLVEKELAAEEAVRAQLGPLPRAPVDAERTARTLATLTQTLHALQRLRCGLPPESDDDDDLPRDIDEFRRDLARRIDAFVASRTEPRHADGDPGPAPVDEAR